MANVYKPGLLQIRPQWTKDPDLNTSPANVLWFQSGAFTVPTLSELAGIQNNFDATYSLIWQNVGPSTLAYTGSVIIDWSSNTGLENDSVGTFSPVAGSHTTGSGPSNVAILLSYTTGERFRGGHFRTYLPYIAPFVLEGDPADHVKPAFISQLGTSYDTMVNTMKLTGILGGQTQVLYRHRHDPVNATLYQVKSFGWQTEIATQRRRLRKVAHR